MVLEFITTRDYNLMRRVQNWPAPRWIRLWMMWSTRAGDGWLWCALGLLVLLFGGPSRFAAVAAGGLAAGVGIGLFLFLKERTGRTRPCEIEPHCWAKLLPPDQFSFPSGHTITAFAICLSVSAYYPGLLPILLFCALSVAMSRVVLGMHFLSDVVAGALIGSALACGSVWLIRIAI
jgi:undecaprenyl-diphosphatase